MSDVQKVIKYIAIAFAIYLIINIVVVVFSCLTSFFYIFDDEEYYTSTKEPLQVDGRFAIKELIIDLASANLTIEEGTTFGVETNNKYVTVKQDKNYYRIEEKKHHWFKHHTNSQVTVYIPSLTILEKASIETGAGKVKIEKLQTNILDLTLGAGQVVIDNLYVTKKAEIEGGAGEILIKDGTLNNLNLEIGVGHAKINSKVLGNSKIEAGIGELDINLFGQEKDYNILAEKGLGNIKIAGENIKSETTYGTGENKIKVEGGIGSIKIDYEKQMIDNETNEEEVLPSKTFTRTYTVLNKTPYEEENSFYLTLKIYQGAVDTVIVKDFKEDISENKTYEFTFLKDSTKSVKDEIKEIFNNYKIVRVKETSKLGLDQIQDKID